MKTGSDAQDGAGELTAPPASPVTLSTAEHYVWGQGCDGWRLLSHDELSIILERMPPGTRETAHSHRFARQFFYVLVGRLTIECGERSVPLRGGEGMHVPPGVMHEVCNLSDNAAVFLVISSPSTIGDRINSILDGRSVRGGPNSPP